MSAVKNQEIMSLSEYIKNTQNQEIKVILLKLKNELNKEDVTWDQIKPVLKSLGKKDDTVLHDIVPLILDL